MKEVLIKGFSPGDSPKDVLDTLSSLGVRPHEVGKIWLANRAALCQVEPRAAQRLLRHADVKVPTGEDSEEIKVVDAYVKKFQRLVQLEREAEMRAMEKEIRKLSGKEREKKGRAVLGLRGTRAGREVGGYYLVKYGRSREIDTQISVGDLVLVSRGDPLKSDLTGTVVEKTKRSITVAFDSPPPKWAVGDGIRIDLYANDVTFQRMMEALERIRHAEGRLRELRNTIIGLNYPGDAEPKDVDFVDTDLNYSQREAVEHALGAPDFFLIHGPPGTGKTRTITEVIVQEVRRGNKVLATAESNIAADNILDYLIERGVEAVRVGHPARVSKSLKERTLSAIVENHPLYKKAESLRERAYRLIEKRDRYQRPVPRWRRGMSDETILYLAREGKGARGVPPRVIRSMAKWIHINRKVQKLFEEAERLEERAIREVLEEAEVVVTTNAGAGLEFLEDVEFDVAVIDEGSQATEPSALIPISRAKRFIMAGDHKQLPPTILSEKAQPELSRTLFERLIEKHPKLSRMLRVQYRMHESIMEFPNREFYNGKLEAHSSVRRHTLEDLGVSEPEVGRPWADILRPKEPLGFVDTSHLPERLRRERRRPGSKSRENPMEVAIVAFLSEQLIRQGLSQEDLAVISPYDDQVDLISKALDELGLDDVEVNTVDGFQGREKEAVIVSFVRSNPRGEIGFLKDMRRLNVAITRPRRKLICIGDSGTLSSHPTYRRFIEYVKKSGALIKPDELREVAPYLDLVCLAHGRAGG
ncbi:IGHMBP2 family helicase [Methanopyrus sp.]